MRGYRSVCGEAKTAGFRLCQEAKRMSRSSLSKVFSDIRISSTSEARSESGGNSSPGMLDPEEGDSVHVMLSLCAART